MTAHTHKYLITVMLLILFIKITGPQENR